MDHQVRVRVTSQQQGQHRVDELKDSSPGTFDKVKKTLAAALSSNITHMFGQDQQEPSI